MGVEGQAEDTVSSLLLQTERSIFQGQAFRSLRPAAAFLSPSRVPPPQAVPSGKPSCACAGWTLKWGPHKRDTGV